MYFSFICYNIILKLIEILLHQKLIKEFQSFNLQFFILIWIEILISLQINFFYAKKLSTLFYLITVELQWNFESWTVFYVIWTFCKLILMFLFFFKKIFWLLIMFFICRKAFFLQNSVTCFVCFLWARFKTEFSLQTEIWNELW